MTHDELREAVDRAVSSVIPSARVTDAVVAALAPLVVTEPGSVTLDNDMIITYHADNPKRWHWAVNGMHGDVHRLAHIHMADEELVRCLALREPLVGEDAEFDVADLRAECDALAAFADVWKDRITSVLDAVAAGWNSGSGTTLDRAENVIRELADESEGWLAARFDVVGAQQVADELRTERDALAARLDASREITDAQVEAAARAIAAQSMGLVRDTTGARLPDDLWRQAVPRARAALEAARAAGGAS